MGEEAEEDAHGQTATTMLGAWLAAGGKGRAFGRQGALLSVPCQPHLLPRLSPSSASFFFITWLTLALVSAPVSWTLSSASWKLPHPQHSRWVVFPKTTSTPGLMPCVPPHCASAEAQISPGI